MSDEKNVSIVSWKTRWEADVAMRVSLVLILRGWCLRNVVAGHPRSASAKSQLRSRRHHHNTIAINAYQGKHQGLSFMGLLALLRMAIRGS